MTQVTSWNQLRNHWLADTPNAVISEVFDVHRNTLINWDENNRLSDEAQILLDLARKATDESLKGKDLGGVIRVLAKMFKVFEDVKALRKEKASRAEIKKRRFRFKVDCCRLASGEFNNQLGFEFST